MLPRSSKTATLTFGPEPMPAYFAGSANGSNRRPDRQPCASRSWRCSRTARGTCGRGGRAGLVRLNGEDVRYFSAESDLFGGAIRALAEDHNGSIWMGPTAGLYWAKSKMFYYYPVPQEPH